MPVDQHNKTKLVVIPKSMFTLPQINSYQYPKLIMSNVNKQNIDRVLTRGRSETGRLDNYELYLKETTG